MKRQTFVLGTSKARHDEEGLELFITTAPIPANLREEMIVFGRVIRGEDIVQVLSSPRFLSFCLPALLSSPIINMRMFHDRVDVLVCVLGAM